jgi:fumarate hydratase subunit alpha
MREIQVTDVIQTVKSLCIDANLELSPDMEKTLRDAAALEKSPLCKDVIGDLCLNLDAARQLHVPVCQDTGMAVVFLEVGQEIHIVGGGLEEAVNEGVREGYVEGRLRLSVVSDPLRRENTGDNTPAVIHTSVVPGDKLHITVAPKGFGSENMSAIRMFTPSATENDIVEFVAETVSRAGSLPCPPVVVGVGIGGDFEYAALLSKKALCRPLCQPQNDSFYRQLEANMLDRINRLGIGSQGFGGTVTALAVNIEVYATHIAGLPVAVNMGCHVTRHKSATL